MSNQFVAKHDPALAPGSWKGLVDSGAGDDRTIRAVMMACPNGHPAVLSGHTIHPDGRVEPSVVCPSEGCDFHEFVILEDWKK